ncbi:hypothetical protein CUZ56_00131 [Saezia sanguinis]|jgi:hypothetical protein|uniref:Uncharacterized protein n=1 Tax=Saezia sanguinis TaxID=1965230 RepID=A0A433SG44_9BURK|nr:hypothetical protein [Saezia sanguinis]RUS67656.1 hypothetical protein CUZ56_00131 [Saezia sanguinis]
MNMVFAAITAASTVICAYLVFRLYQRDENRNHPYINQGNTNKYANGWTYISLIIYPSTEQIRICNIASAGHPISGIAEHGSITSDGMYVPTPIHTDGTALIDLDIAIVPFFVQAEPVLVTFLIQAGDAAQVPITIGYERGHADKKKTIVHLQT